MYKKAEELKEIVIRIFLKIGVSKKVASRVVEHLVNADLVGVSSHGVMRIPQYITWIKDGTIKPNAKIKIIKETDLMVSIDARKSFGQVAAYEASKIAVVKGKSKGMGLVTVKNASHIGRLGEYAEQIVENDLICLIIANAQGAGQLVAPWGGKERRLSANPMAWGIPSGEGNSPIILDFSTSIVAEGRILIHRSMNKIIPEGWVIDFNGEPTTDPNDLYGPPEGSILPMAGHKGFGLSLIIELLSGALSGGGCSRKNVDKFYNSFTIITIDPSQVCNYFNFLDSINGFIEYVKSSAPIKDGAQIILPNDAENENKKINSLYGIKIEDGIWKTILSVAKGLGLNL